MKIYINKTKMTDTVDIKYKESVNELMNILQDKGIYFEVSELTRKVINSGFNESDSIVLKTMDGRYLGYNEAIEYAKNYTKETKE